ncbi:MAG TPA: hypothetical protein VGK67_20360 [Myxococcales bacterium]|jgi:hypothetical protein
MVARGWLGTDLNGLRPDSGTYGLYPIESLPPLDGISLDGSLEWLLPLEPELEAQQVTYRPDAARRAEVAKRLESLVKEAAAKKVALPPTFAKVMGSQEIRDRFPSSTACYFDLPAGIAPAPAPLPGGHLIRFLNDQQGCAFWYLWLKPDGTDSVVVSGALLDPGSPPPPKGQAGEIYECADPFEEFLLRYWLENTLWFALTSETTLKEAHGRYARHYRK